MKKTINQLRAELESLINSHLFFNGFYYGDIATSLNKQDSIYPAMYCNIVAGSFDEYYTYFNIDLFSCDKVVDNTKELFEVESDTVQNLRDIYEVIKKSERWNSFSKISAPTIATRKYQDRLQDNTTGWGMTINVGVNTVTGVCDLPIDGYPSGGDTCAPVTVLLNGEFYESVPSGGTVDVITETDSATWNGVEVLTGMTSSDTITYNGIAI